MIITICVYEKSYLVALLQKLCLHLHWHFSLENEYFFGAKLCPCLLGFVPQCNIFSVYKQIPFSERKLAFDRNAPTGLWPELCAFQRSRLEISWNAYCVCGMSSLVSCALLGRCAAPAVPCLLMEIHLTVFGWPAAMAFTNSEVCPSFWPTFVQKGCVNV